MAIQLKDPRSISSMVGYPLKVNGIPAVANASEFAAQFKDIFNAKVRAAVLAEAPDQFVQDATQGVMVTRGGEVWLREVCLSERVSGSCPPEDTHFLLAAINNVSAKSLDAPFNSRRRLSRGIICLAPRKESMIGISQLRWMSAHSRLALPRR